MPEYRTTFECDRCQGYSEPCRLTIVEMSDLDTPTECPYNVHGSADWKRVEMIQMSDQHDMPDSFESNGTLYKPAPAKHSSCDGCVFADEQESVIECLHPSLLRICMKHDIIWKTSERP